MSASTRKLPPLLITRCGGEYYAAARWEAAARMHPTAAYEVVFREALARVRRAREAADGFAISAEDQGWAAHWIAQLWEFDGGLQFAILLLRFQDKLREYQAEKYRELRETEGVDCQRYLPLLSLYEGLRESVVAVDAPPVFDELGLRFQGRGFEPMVAALQKRYLERKGQDTSTVRAECNAKATKGAAECLTRTLCAGGMTHHQASVQVAQSVTHAICTLAAASAKRNMACAGLQEIMNKLVKTSHAAAVIRNTRARSARAGHVMCAAGGDGDGGSDGDGDGDAERPVTPSVFDYAALASRWNTSKKSLQNRFSADPRAFPPAIKLPGAKGPRWLAGDVLQFEQSLRPANRNGAPTSKRRGRPRGQR